MGQMIRDPSVKRLDNGMGALYANGRNDDRDTFTLVTGHAVKARLHHRTFLR